jgi:hypothetical protein
LLAIAEKLNQSFSHYEGAFQRSLLATAAISTLGYKRPVSAFFAGYTAKPYQSFCRCDGTFCVTATKLNQLFCHCEGAFQRSLLVTEAISTLGYKRPVSASFADDAAKPDQSFCHCEGAYCATAAKLNQPFCHCEGAFQRSLLATAAISTLGYKRPVSAFLADDAAKPDQSFCRCVGTFWRPP